VQNRRSSRILTSKRGSRASAKQRRGPHIADCRVWSATVEIRGFSHFRVWLQRCGSRVSEKKHNPRAAELYVWEVKLQKRSPGRLRVLVSKRGLRASDVVPEKRGLEGRILYLLDR